MNKLARQPGLLLLFFLTASLFAGGGRDAGTEQPPVIQVTGRIRLVGGAPFTELVITAERGEWYIAKDEEHKLSDYQQRTVTVEGTETVKTLTFANGMSAGERRTLSNIRIISVE